MYAVEFQTTIKNGTIEIPEVYRDRFKERVRVILLAEEENAAMSLIDQLLQHPLKVVWYGSAPVAVRPGHERIQLFRQPKEKDYERLHDHRCRYPCHRNA